MADELVAAMMPHLCAPQRDVRVRYTFIMVMAGLLGDVASAEDKRLILLHRQNDGQSRLVKRHEMVVMRLFFFLGSGGGGGLSVKMGSSGFEVASARLTSIEMFVLRKA